MGKRVAGPAPIACVACGRRGGQAGCVGRSYRLWVLRRGWGYLWHKHINSVL